MCLLFILWFDQVVGFVLKVVYLKVFRIDYKIVGVSGYQLIFFFVIEIESGQMMLIQIVFIKDGKVDWSLVYCVVGKMLDIKNVYEDILWCVILEFGDEEDN